MLEHLGFAGGVDLNPFDDDSDDDEMGTPLQGTADWLFKAQVLRQKFRAQLEKISNESQWSGQQN